MVLGRVSCAVVSDRNTHQGVEYYKEHQLFLLKALSKKFDQVLNTPLVFTLKKIMQEANFCYLI